MKTIEENLSCTGALKLLRPYMDGDVDAETEGLIDEHLDGCASCSRQMDARQRMHHMLQDAYRPRRITDDFDQVATKKLQQRREQGTPAAAFMVEVEEDELEPAVNPAPEGILDTLSQRFGAAPWWMISGAFHALVLLLVTLIGMALLRQQQDDVVIVTDLQKERKPEDLEQPRERDIFEKVVPIVTEEIQSEETIVTHEEVEIAEQVETADDSDAHDTFGEDGISDVFLGGSGTVAALGLGGGGGGAFGRPNGQGGRLRRAIRGGGGKATESAVDRALAWLARNQEADGRWDPRKHEGGCHNGTSETGATGLALLAFLGAGHTEKIGKYRGNVRRAVEWFIKHQAPNGQFKCPSDPHSSRLYGHGIAAMAMAEAAGMGRMPDTRKAAQKGVDFVAESQNRMGADNYEGAGWDYTSQGGTNDTSVTSWMVLALKSAKVCGLGVEPRCFEGSLKWLDACQGKDDYKLGIWYRGKLEDVRARQAEKPRMNYNNRAAKEHALLAAAGAMRLFLGAAAPGDPRLNATGDYLLKGLPKYQADRGTCFYHFYYGTLTMFQIGGMHWKQWNGALKQALVPTQIKGGADDGSWDPSADWLGKWGGRVYTTAMGALCLEVYYRYLPMYRE